MLWVGTGAEGARWTRRRSWSSCSGDIAELASLSPVQVEAEEAAIAALDEVRALAAAFPPASMSRSKIQFGEHKAAACNSLGNSSASCSCTGWEGPAPSVTHAAHLAVWVPQHEAMRSTRRSHGHM